MSALLLLMDIISFKKSEEISIFAKLFLERKKNQLWSLNKFEETTTINSLQLASSLMCALKKFLGKQTEKIERERDCEPRRSFSRRLSSTRTGSEPCKRVMISSNSEPARLMTPAGALAGLGFLVRALKEANDVSLEGGSASPLLVMWAVEIRFRGDPVLPCSSNSSVSPKIEWRRNTEREREGEAGVWGFVCLFVYI